MAHDPEQAGDTAPGLADVAGISRPTAAKALTVLERRPGWRPARRAGGRARGLPGDERARVPEVPGRVLTDLEIVDTKLFPFTSRLSEHGGGMMSDRARDELTRIGGARDAAGLQGANRDARTV
jgi:hypothetical protein